MSSQPAQPFIVPTLAQQIKQAPSIITQPALSPWQELLVHIHAYFYDPDIAALEIALSACISHFHKGADPAWLFVIGFSGADKSSLIVNCCMALEQSHMLGDLTSKTFLSAYTGQPNASLLHRIGSGILVFKDFTTFQSKRPEEQGEIVAQMREIYDGYFRRDTGKGSAIEWTGKMTVIAATTPSIERMWSMLGPLGERFLQIRIGRKNGIKQAEAAQRQSGKEEFISTRMRELTKLLLRATPPITYPPPLPNEQQRYKIACLAELIAHARGFVPKSKRGEIIGLAEIEHPSRASKELSSLVSGHAALFRRSEIDDKADLWLAQRVAKNSMPVVRYMLLNTISKWSLENKACLTSDIAAATSLPLSTIRYHLADLLSCHMIETETEGLVDNEHRLSDNIIELWKSAFA